MTLDEATVWKADERFLPAHLRSSDNAKRIEHYKKALRIAIATRLNDTQREQIRLFYEEGLNKTQIGERCGVGSSAVCKSLKAAQSEIRQYIEMYMDIYDLLVRENLEENDEYYEIQGG